MWGVIAGVVAGLSATVLTLKWNYPWLAYDLLAIWPFLRVAISFLKLRRANLKPVDVFEGRAKKTPHKVFLVFEEQTFSYGEADGHMNRVAHAARALGLQKGDVVAMIMGNCPEFIWTWMGLSKIGVQTAFINSNLRSHPLSHCLDVCQAAVLFVGDDDELINAAADVFDETRDNNIRVFVWGRGRDNKLPREFRPFQPLLDAASTVAPDPHLRDGVNFTHNNCFVFTSGTTGLPKAALLSHAKLTKGALMWHYLPVTDKDVLYLTLPLYHSSGSVIGASGAMCAGMTLVLRRKFSASRFWEDCRRHRVTAIQYIGELCRYLCAQPRSELDGLHSVRVALGNGLRKDVWSEFVDRFKIPKVLEFYAATEANGGFMNVLNKFGSVGRSSPLTNCLMPSVFLECDQISGEPVRGVDGLCRSVHTGVPGLFACPISHLQPFDGYKGSRNLSESKILRNVLKNGDVYFNSGDLLTVDEDCFVYFTDRIGDTFRWKGENVSTLEVANVLCQLPWIQDACVYGVKVAGAEGRVGMAALTLAGGQPLTLPDLHDLFCHCQATLPPYAIPRFLRIMAQLHMTSTFKPTKMDLCRQAYDLDLCKGDDLYCIDFAVKTFNAMDSTVFKDIEDGNIKL